MYLDEFFEGLDLSYMYFYSNNSLFYLSYKAAEGTQSDSSQSKPRDDSCVHTMGYLSYYTYPSSLYITALCSVRNS